MTSIHGAVGAIDHGDGARTTPAHVGSLFDEVERGLNRASFRNRDEVRTGVREARSALATGDRVLATAWLTAVLPIVEGTAGVAPLATALAALIAAL